jgi:peptidoglycan hydrolase CwlO-like protein
MTTENQSASAQHEQPYSIDEAIEQATNAVAKLGLKCIEKLKKENAKLKEQLNFANPQLLSLTQANTELQKQVEELTQQVFDLKRLLRNYL